MALDRIPRTAQQRITEVGRLPGAAGPVAWRPDPDPFPQRREPDGSLSEIVAAASQLPDDTALDGELVAWEGDRLAFERLRQRAHRRAATAARAAGPLPAHFVAFDLLRTGADLTAQSYRTRRAALEPFFTDHSLQVPWTPCVPPQPTPSRPPSGWHGRQSGWRKSSSSDWTSGMRPPSELGASTGSGTRPKPWSARSLVP
ncbi:hypothetical protein [Streptomyces mirabilis]|uniref:ATP-dependent DNA ligase n=1 Tax=Streptomyces mirabilis TaxID=68239 RepID=UPI0033328CBB